MWVIFAGLLLSSCGDGPTTPSAADYQNVEWRLVSLQRPDQSIASPPGGASFTARFGDDGRLAVRADCNVCGAEYAATGTALSVGAMACTQAFCASAPFDVEYAQVLDNATAFELQDQGLVVRSPQGTLRFSR
jgi:heat shock protein HslJ